MASIKAALDLAHREAEELKERCRDLEALLKSRSNELGIDLHHEDKIQDQRMSTDELPENDHDHVDSGDEQQQTTLDIDNISLPRARLLLKVSMSGHVSRLLQLGDCGALVSPKKFFAIRR